MEHASKRGAKYSIEVNRMSFVMFQFGLEKAYVCFNLTGNGDNSQGYRNKRPITSHNVKQIKT